MRTQIIKGINLSQKLLDLINKQRIKEYKKINLFEKKYHKDTIFFFIKDKGKIVSFGLLRDIKVNYLDKIYNIKGIGGIMSVEKGKGYGKILIGAMINYLRKTGKTGFGFCGRKNSPFYEKAGLKTKKNLNLRFVMKNPKTGEIIRDLDKDCDGIYYEGKDRLITKMLKTKYIGYYWLPEIKEPHW